MKWSKLPCGTSFRCATMTGLEILQSVQFVTIRGKRVVLLSADDWEDLIEWLKTLEDERIAREALAQLKAAGSDRTKAGWLEWKNVVRNLATAC